MAINTISVSKIYSLPTEPANRVADRFWFNTHPVSGGNLYRCN